MVINLFVDCRSGFQPLSLGKSSLLHGSPIFLTDSCEQRTTPVRRDFPSHAWSVFVQSTPQVTVKVLTRRSSFKAVQSLALMLRAITNEGGEQGTATLRWLMTQRWSEAIALVTEVDRTMLSSDVAWDTDWIRLNWKRRSSILAVMEFWGVRVNTEVTKDDRQTMEGTAVVKYISSLILPHLSLNSESCWCATHNFATSFLHFPCSPLPSGTWRTPGLFIPRCCLPTSSSVCLVFFPLSLCLARWSGQTWWTGDMIIPLQFVPLYHGQVFTWSDCLLSLGMDFLVVTWLSTSGDW